MRKLRVWFMLCILLMGSSFAAVISNISQLDSAAVFHFSIMSDNKGLAPAGSSHVQKCDSWIKNSGGIPSAFVIGLGDHTVKTSSTSDPFLPFIKNDSYWKTKFYPGIADGENQSFGGSQGNWGSGYKLFNYVDNFYGRSNVQFRPKTSDPDDALVDYYAKVTISGYNVHILNLHFSDNYDGSMGGSNPFVEATQAFMQSKLQSLAATKTDKDIIVVLAHSTGGDFVEQGNINSTRKNLLLSTADLCVSATTHKFGWWNRYKEYNNGNSAVSYNSGSVGNTGDENGYMDIHVLANPTRITVQYISTEKTTRTLHTGVLGSQPDANKYGTPIIKTIDGKWGVVDWNNLPLSTSTGTNGAAFVSQVVPSTLVAGKTTNVTVRVKNTGTLAWSGNYYLGSQNPQDNFTWGMNRVKLPAGVTVAAGQEYAFSFVITAPVNVGTYNFQWKMIDAEEPNLGWFGALTANKSIAVTAGALVTVPWVTNLTESAAGTSITNAGLVVGGVSREYHATVAAGKVFSQTPGGGTSVARGSSVALAVSLGPQTVPSVGSTITLKAVNGKYVSATYSTNNTLIANKTTVSNYERFKVVNATNSVALQCMGNNKFVSIDALNGSKPMVANRASIGSYEKFQLVQSGSQIAIKSVTSTNYASAISGGAAPLQAKQTYIGSYEKFTWKVE